MIVKIIELQPNPALFFKSYLELDIANMVSILSFDSRCMTKLLTNVEDIEELNADNPIFYKMQKNNVRTNKLEITTALDIALDHNQISAV